MIYLPIELWDLIILNLDDKSLLDTLSLFIYFKIMPIESVKQLKTWHYLNNFKLGRIMLNTYNNISLINTKQKYINHYCKITTNWWCLSHDKKTFNKIYNYKIHLLKQIKNQKDKKKFENLTSKIIQI